jgi:hypothetical protein
MQNRYSESALPSDFDPEMSLSAQSAAHGTRNSMIGIPHGGLTDRSSITSDLEPLNYWHFDDLENSLLSLSASQGDTYFGVDIQVNTHSINSKGVVMYHVDIKGPDGLLSAYTIRRRYSSFKTLYVELTRLLRDYTAKLNGNVGIETELDLLASSASGSTERSGLGRPPISPLPRPGGIGGGVAPRVGVAQVGGGIQRHPPLPSSMLSSSMYGSSSSSSNGCFVLPPLPSAGVWTFLKRHDYGLVEQRKRRFEEILRIAISHPATKHSKALENFLSYAPSIISQRGSSYVSLQDYSVPVFDRQRESIERKRRKRSILEGRRLRSSSDISRIHE